MTRSHKGKTCNGKKGGCKICAVKYAVVRAFSKQTRRDNKRHVKKCILRLGS